jgi:ribosomal protein S6 kinase alpha-5
LQVIIIIFVLLFSFFCSFVLLISFIYYSIFRKCRNRKTGQYFAVKILSRFKIDSTNEVKHLKKCQGHENIVKLFDVLQDEYHTYIIMEFLTGGELFERIKNKKILTEREVGIIMKNLVSAIQYIHSQGIVHRDIKPENVIFSDCTENSKLKIVDFGFAKLKPSSTTNSTSLQTPCFTLNYAAPEVLNKAIDLNSSNGYDESCDLWSLGVILHTMLSGQVPFCNASSEQKPVTSMQNEIIEKIKNSSKSLDLKHKPWNTISESAKSLVKGLLNIDPKKRLTLKEITRHEWLKDCNNFDFKPSYYENCLSTPKLLTSSTQLLVNSENDALKQLKLNINRAYNAYHEAEKQGLLKIELKAVFEAPLAQRRRNKRSTSSNASSESNVSTNSISSSLSTSTTSINNCTSTSSYTPTKKCPSSCGKLGEQTIFNFTDNCINEYLDQSNNRPITRSITHSKLVKNDHLPTTSTSTIEPDIPLYNNLPFSNAKYNDIPKIINQTDSTATKITSNVGVKHCLELDNVNNNECLENQQQQMSLGPVPPSSKRLKRCSTILID